MNQKLASQIKFLRENFFRDGAEGETVHAVADAAEKLAAAVDPRVPDTFEKLVQCCKNVGVGLSCGACASLFYTGSAHPGATCGTQAYEHTCAKALRAREVAGKQADWWTNPVKTPPNAVEHTYEERLTSKDDGLFGVADLAHTVAQIEKLCEVNEALIRRRIEEGRPLPKMYESELCCVSSPISHETLLNAETALSRKFADIEELVAWRVAELRASGERAYVGAFQRVVPEGRRDGYAFVCVVRGDGRIEQPERAEHWMQSSARPSRCRIVVEGAHWGCLSAGCGAEGAVEDGRLVHVEEPRKSRVTTITVAEATGPHPYVEGEVCLFDRVRKPLPQRIAFCGQQVDVACDRRCDKAWGLDLRPRKQLSEDPDDYVFTSDGELGTAPFPSDSTEGDQGKPSATSHQGPLNKWCVRQCERSVMVDAGRPVELRDFARPRPNRPNKSGR